MKLSGILKGITSLNFKDCDVENITLDSRKANPQSLFCAVKGHNIDARKFINQVIENGVAVILADANSIEEIVVKDDIQIIYIKGLSSKLSQIAHNFYQKPSHKLKNVAITGTNGKTTISQLVAQWAAIVGYKPATMGTIGNGLYGELKEAENTTGSAFDIQENLADFVNQGANISSMEVSSHGLVQSRVSHVYFDVAVFTNLTQDHLDYHKTMDEYFAAKALLFTKFKTKYKVINIDDEYGLKLAEMIKDKDSIIATSTKRQDLANHFKNYIYISHINYTSTGFDFRVVSNFCECNMQTHLVGKFNLSNIIQSFAVMVGLGINIKDLCCSAKNLKPVVGRMEVFQKINKPTVIIDYAHTPDALEKALHAANEHISNELWCIFGCGGDRDITKRPLMAQIAEKNADRIILTNDNPRTEDEDNIIKDILKGIEYKENIKIIKDRFKAIEYAVKNANRKDIILVAGKGHEDYQIFGIEKTHYSDRESACKILKIKECICKTS